MTVQNQSQTPQQARSEHAMSSGLQARSQPALWNHTRLDKWTTSPSDPAWASDAKSSPNHGGSPRTDAKEMS